MNLLVVVAAAAVVLAASAGAAMGDPPPVFDTRPYAEARKAAEEGRKWFVVKATAEWCAPCKQMDKTTWRDEKVVAWAKANAVIVAVDVDTRRDLAQELKIRAMPTMVAFKDGREFDRVVGYKGPEDFLDWLEGIARGEKSIEAVERKAAPGPDGQVDVRARMDHARALAQAGKTAEAEEYCWLWEHMLEHDRAYYGVRLSFMASEMERLAAEDDGARAKFAALRDTAARTMEGEKVDRETVVDWVHLNKIVGEQERTLAWFDRVKGERRWRPIVQRVSRELEDLLIKRKRWADLGGLYPDALAMLEREHEIMKMMPKHDLPAGMGEAARKQIEDMPARMLREKAARMYAALLAADREEEGAKLGARAREMEASAAMRRELVSAALEAGEARREHLSWLEGGEAADRSLRSRVERALADEKGR